MGDIDDAGNAEDQRQSNCDKEQTRRGGEPVERLKQKCAESHVMLAACSLTLSLKGEGKRVRGKTLIRFCWPQLLDLGIVRKHRSTVNIFEVGHCPLAVLQYDLADIGAHRTLVIAGAIDERPERAVDF
jgi:hypothetical protein